jgi:membrane fusion protein (multidrug efflux system)
VFLEESGRAKWRSVGLGSIVRKQVVVESGLAAGDSIVIAGHRDLEDGDELLIQRRGSCCSQGRATFP